jgi:hypothetical protein
MAKPTAPGEEPSESEIDGNTGVRIRISTDTRKERIKRRARGVMGDPIPQAKLFSYGYVRLQGE